MTTNLTVVPGTRIVSTSSVPGGSWGGYIAPGVYEAQARQSDGVVTWRLVSRPLGTFWFQGRQMVTGFRSARKAADRAEQIAAEMGVEFVPGVRHGTRA